MRTSKKYGRNVAKDRTYRAHKRNSLAHFKTRWKTRLTKPYGIPMPPIEPMREELRKAMYTVSGSSFFTVFSRRHDSTRLLGKVGGGQEIVISFDHNLKVPVTVWLKKDYDDDEYEQRGAKAAASTETLP